jgi:hypothetical protein
MVSSAGNSPRCSLFRFEQILHVFLLKGKLSKFKNFAWFRDLATAPLNVPPLYFTRRANKFVNLLLAIRAGNPAYTTITTLSAQFNS